MKQHPPEALRASVLAVTGGSSSGRPSLREQAWRRGLQPPLSLRCALRAGGRSQRGGAALARLPWPAPRQSHASRKTRNSIDN